MMIIITIVLCATYKHVKPYKFWIWYFKEKLLILDFKCWNTFRCNGYWDTIKKRNKASEQLICSCDNNIVKRDFPNIMNWFHAFVWLNKAMKLFDGKSWDLSNLLNSQKWMQQ